VAHGLRVEPEHLRADHVCRQRIGTGYDSPVSTAWPPGGPVVIIAGCPAVTARLNGKRFAIAVMNECMSS